MFKETLWLTYPKLRNAGGYELLRSATASRNKLENMWVPPGGFSSSHLADESGLGQALCFIRPIQQDLQLETEPPAHSSSSI